MQPVSTQGSIRSGATSSRLLQCAAIARAHRSAQAQEPPCPTPSCKPSDWAKAIPALISAAEDYEAIVERAQAAFETWRNTPAPRRGEAVRLCAEALRAHKDALGSLVALEMGKIKPEGDGEVQEMIDIADFAVGLSRQLYGLSMHSERPGHRMYEQWHPLGVIGIISAFNFPVAVWSWNAFVAAVCGNISIWKPSPKTPLSAIASMQICNEALKAGGFPDIFFLFNDAGTELSKKFVDDHRIALISFTTRSSWTKAPTLNLRSRRSCSARSAPPASAAPLRDGCSCIRPFTTTCWGNCATPMRRCRRRSATLQNLKR